MAGRQAGRQASMPTTGVNCRHAGVDRHRQTQTDSTDERHRQAWTNHTSKEGRWSNLVKGGKHTDRYGWNVPVLAGFVASFTASLPASPTLADT